jgi:hypothetical protein
LLRRQKPAEDDDEAHQMVDEEDGGVRLGLNGFSGLLRENGDVLWDGATEIKTRVATEVEHERWVKALAAETGSANEGKQIDLQAGDDPDDLIAYLIPVHSVDDGEEEVKKTKLRNTVGRPSPSRAPSPARLGMARASLGCA